MAALHHPMHSNEEVLSLPTSCRQMCSVTGAYTRGGKTPRHHHECHVAEDVYAEAGQGQLVTEQVGRLLILVNSLTVACRKILRSRRHTATLNPHCSKSLQQPLLTIMLDSIIITGEGEVHVSTKNSSLPSENYFNVLGTRGGQTHRVHVQHHETASRRAMKPAPKK